MTVPTTSWDETSPAGSQSIQLGDNRIREMKTQVREVMDADHKFESSGQDADNGKHNQVSLIEAADIGSGAEGLPILGAQTINGKAELLYTDEDDNDIQLTSAGKLDLGSGRLDNAEALTSLDNAGTADLDLIQANTSDQAVITPALLPAAGIILPEITAPTTTANQGGLFTKNDGTQTELYFVEESDGDEVQITKSGVLNTTGLGSWADKAFDTIYEATTDGFVCVSGIEPSTDTDRLLSGITDANVSPTTIRVVCNPFHMTSQAGPISAGFTMPVKKGDYWTVTFTGSASGGTYDIFWIPLGV